MQACEMDENRHIHCETEVKNSSPKITIAFVRYVSESQTLERTMHGVGCVVPLYQPSLPIQV